jgi:hypothetical protein
MTPPDYHALAIARRVETIIAKIPYARDRDEVLDLQQRATEDISGLHSALKRSRLSERVGDAADARLQEIDQDSLASAPGRVQPPLRRRRRSEMPKVSDVYKSSYLRAADVEEPLTVTIKSASLEELGEDKDEKIVVTFKELDRGLVLNRTNADYISMICESDDTEDWPGTRLGLFVQPVSFKGKLVDSIRVTKPQHLKAADDMVKTTAAKAPRKQKAVAAAAAPDDDMDDEIPMLGKK